MARISQHISCHVLCRRPALWRLPRALALAKHCLSALARVPCSSGPGQSCPLQEMEQPPPPPPVHDLVTVKFSSATGFVTVTAAIPATFGFYVPDLHWDPPPEPLMPHHPPHGGGLHHPAFHHGFPAPPPPILVPEPEPMPDEPDFPEDNIMENPFLWFDPDDAVVPDYVPREGGSDDESVPESVVTYQLIEEVYEEEEDPEEDSEEDPEEEDSSL